MNRRLVVSATAGAVLLFAGVAFSAIPGAGGVISACYDKQSGQVRIYDAGGGLPKACGKNEAAISWNQQGPAGPPGPQGEPGISLFANVDHLGNLVSGTATGSSRIDLGEYRVAFGRDVSTCAGVASLGFNVSGEIAPGGGAAQVFVAYPPVGDRAALVETRDFQGSLVDSAFHLIVTC